MIYFSDFGVAAPVGHTWNAALAQVYRTDLSYHFMIWAVMNGGESGTLSVGLTHAGGLSVNRQAGLSIWRGCTATPIEALASSVSGGASATSNYVAPSISTLGANRTVINLVSIEDDRTQTPPSGYTEVYDAVDPGGTPRNMGSGLNYKTYASAGATGAQTTTGSGSARFGVATFGLIPSGGSAPTLVGSDITATGVSGTGEKFVTCTYPGGIVTGDIAILHCNIASAGIDAGATLSTLPA